MKERTDFSFQRCYHIFKIKFYTKCAIALKTYSKTTECKFKQINIFLLQHISVTSCGTSFYMQPTRSCMQSTRFYLQSTRFYLQSIWFYLHSTRFYLHSTRFYLHSTRLWAYGVVVSMFDFHCSDPGSNPCRGSEKFHVYNYTIERHPWQVSENRKPRVHPSHMREIG